MRWLLPTVPTALFALACGGSPPIEAPPAPAPAPVPEAPVPPETVRLWWLEGRSSCRWMEVVASSPAMDPPPEATPVRALPGPCPPKWTFAVPDDSERVVIFADEAGFVSAPDDVAAFQGTPDGIDLATWRNGSLVACGTVDTPSLQGDAPHRRKWILDGRTFELDSADGLAPVLTRQWRREPEGEGWVEVLVEPVQAAPSAWDAPPCFHNESWPDDTTFAGPWRGFEPSEAWPAPQGEELAALRALADIPWAGPRDGRLAASVEEVGGRSLVSAPLAWRPAGGAWALVPGLEAAGTATFDARDRWLLVNGPDGARLYDLVAGTLAWSAEHPAAFATEQP